MVNADKDKIKQAEYGRKWILNHRKLRNSYNATYRAKNKNKLNVLKKIWRNNNPEIYRESQRKCMRKQSAQLTDGYIRHRLKQDWGFVDNNIDEFLIKTHRLLLILKRRIKNETGHLPRF